MWIVDVQNNPPFLKFFSVGGKNVTYINQMTFYKTRIKCVRECVPNQVTYNSFIRYYSVTNEIELAVEMMRTMKKMGHGVPGSSTYTPLIHALVETRRAAEARDLVVEMVEAGLVPREYTYKLVLDALSSEGIVDTLDEELHKRMREGIDQRYRRVMKIKPFMARKEVVHEIGVNQNSAVEEI